MRVSSGSLTSIGQFSSDPDQSLFKYVFAEESLRRQGYLTVPGLSALAETNLGEIGMAAEWDLLRVPEIQNTIRLHEEARRDYFTFDDSGALQRHSGFEFHDKTGKSHVTCIGKVAAVLSMSKFLPSSLREFFKTVDANQKLVERAASELVPPSPLPTFTKTRLFSYRESVVGEGMRPHVDGSRVSVIVGESDGLLEVYLNNKWVPVKRPSSQPFALLIPGIAMGELGIPATLHKVSGVKKRRTSLTVFQTPDLGTTIEEARILATRWRPLLASSLILSD